MEQRRKLKMHPHNIVAAQLKEHFTARFLDDRVGTREDQNSTVKTWWAVREKRIAIWALVSCVQALVHI